MYSKLEELIKYKDIVQLIGLFSQTPSDDISCIKSNIKVRLVRFRDDRATLDVYYHKTRTSIFTSTFHYSTCDNYFKTCIGRTANTIVSTHYSKNYPSEFNLNLYERLGVLRTCSLQYPIQEEQYFQELTRFDLPSEEVIESFMQVSSAIVEPYSDIIGFSFMSHNPVQDIKDVEDIEYCMKNLLEQDKLLQINGQFS